jgi:hypothetical protein
MTEMATSPRVQDVASVGTRVSWGAILAGSILSLALYVLLSILGAAVGLTISERVSASNLRITAIGWAIFVICVSLFVGGIVTSAFTVGENKTESVIYGIVMWGLTLVLVLGLGAVGVQTGLNALIRMRELAEPDATESWSAAARSAGVPADQVDEWRRKLMPNRGGATDQPADREAAMRLAWYAFGGIWGSMIAAALGGLVGAGPTFRLVVVRPNGRAIG